MKLGFIILFFVGGIPGFSQDSLKAKVTFKLVHISTQAFLKPDSVVLSQDTTAELLTAFETMDLNMDSSALIVLSLVDRDGSIAKNWSNFIAKYKTGNYLIVVDSGDGADKLDFMTYFYQQRQKGLDIEEAYTLASERSKNRSPNLLHFLSIAK
jgi:hypothetical protein